LPWPPRAPTVARRSKRMRMRKSPSAPPRVA
jgi:hypothetical protein